ncbi:phosphate ABC transporter substrate-binding/OmpA family protein [Mesobacterium pallidum]|uniref:phosphate ABC transporter substrate-binding/OmpA family protein n=1 Tax=Mesobacterium pallidum TaxID=2872037 RepID=UPI001EE2B450|nr:phosphate ABC transporter substrate-binding/OmpA family protein [Mesobacterium pallidum]
MNAFRAALCAALFLVCGPGCGPVPAAAQDVTLYSRDGTIEIGGTLLGYDGEFYRVETIYGEITVDGSGVLCEGVGCPNLDTFVAEVGISGSATMGRVLMPALLEAFAAREGYDIRREQVEESYVLYSLSDRRSGEDVARFHFHVTNTDEGFADLLADEADIVMSLREIRRDEARLASEAGLGDLESANRSRVVALDAMVPIVSPTNPVHEITVLQLAQVLAGRIDNWEKLGGPDAPITVRLRDSASGLAQAVEDRVLAPARLPLRVDVERHPDNLSLAEAVAGDLLSLGVASYSDIGNARALTIGGACDFSLRAERRTIKTEDYPLTAPMFLYLPARRLPKLAREFLRFTRSDPAQIVIRRAGFVDQAPEEIPLDMQGDRLANAVTVAGAGSPEAELYRLVRTLRPMARLSISYRFESGATRLDAQSRSNVQQLAREIEAGTYDNRTLVFVGFSDGQGPHEANQAIAERRAAAVMEAVRTAAETADFSRLEMSSDAFGEAMPMACDDTSWGRQTNRRVEVWLR